MENCNPYYFDPKEKKCKKGMIQCFEMIRGSQNKFNTLQECENKCLPEKGMLIYSKERIW